MFAAFITDFGVPLVIAASLAVTTNILGRELKEWMSNGLEEVTND